MHGHVPPPLATIRPEIAGLPESGIVEIVNSARGRPGLIPLWVGEGDRPTPGFIGEAAMKALADGQTFYTWQRGIPPLRAALARYLSTLYGTGVATERVFVTVGGMQAIMMAVQTLIGAGDELVTPTPAWPNIFGATEIAGGRWRAIPLSPGNSGWRLDLDRLFDACGPRTKAIFLNSPGNPTGWTATADEVLAIRDFARSRGLWIIADEVYGRFMHDGSRVAPSFLQVMEPEERLIVVNTFSKNWAMTGWRIGWAVAPASLGAAFENLMQFSTSGVPTFLQYGALAAIEEGEGFVQAQIAHVAEARALVTERLLAIPRLSLAPPTGGFYAFFSVEGEASSRDLALKLIETANVGLAPGSAFGPGGEGHLRLCFAGSRPMLETSLDRLQTALA